VLAGAAVAASFVAAMLWTTSGHFVPQVSDLYVVAQYAKAMAEGHPFRYNPGEAPTTGSTSLLFTAALALVHALGARGEALIAVAILLGAVLFLASIPLAARVATRLASPREGLLAGALVAFGGPVVWSYLYGSDIALFLFLGLLLLDRWLDWWGGGSAAKLAAAATLVSLARPEGLVLGAALGAASLRRPPAPATPRGRLLPWAGLASALLVLGLQRALTGFWLGTSVAGKSLLVSYGPVESIAIAAKYGVDVLRGLLLGFYPSEAPIGYFPGQAPFGFPPLGLVFVLLAVPLSSAAGRAAAGLWLAAVALTFAAAGPNVYAGVHFNRYLMWAFPGLLAFAAAGLGAATRRIAGSDLRLERALFRGAAGLFVVLAALSTARFLGFYAEFAGGMWRRETAMATFIRTRLPAGVVIADVATNLEYLSTHRSLNLHGVVSPGFVGGSALEREANMLEQMRRLPPAERPSYLLLSRAQLGQSELFRAFSDGAPVHETVTLADDDLLLMRTRWDVLDRGLGLVTGAARGAVASLVEVDRLDIGDPADEAAHGYAVDSRVGDLRIGATVAIAPLAPGAPPLADAGRLVLGREVLRVKNTRAGRDLVVVMRTRTPTDARFLRGSGPTQTAVALPSTVLTVSATGRVVAQVRAPNVDGWNEHVLRVPGDAVADGTTALELSGRYASYRFWFYQ
jgi:hypothetical protein